MRKNVVSTSTKRLHGKFKQRRLFSHSVTMHNDILFLQLSFVHLSNVVIKENHIGHADAGTVHVVPVA